MRDTQMLQRCAGRPSHRNAGTAKFRGVKSLKSLRSLHRPHVRTPRDVGSEQRKHALSVGVVASLVSASSLDRLSGKAHAVGEKCCWDNSRLHRLQTWTVGSTRWTQEMHARIVHPLYSRVAFAQSRSRNARHVLSCLQCPQVLTTPGFSAMLAQLRQSRHWTP